MKTEWLVAVCVLAPAVALANVGFSKTPAYLPVSPGAAVILNSGSTNTTGYRIVVQPNGSAEFVAASARSRDRVPAALAKKFFEDLRAAGPLAALPPAACMKSASFGTEVFVYWNHSRSPDVSCPSNAAGQVILKDALGIAAALHVGTGPRRPVIRPLMPGEARKPLNATPAANASP